jgi:30S ribosomal protein S31
MGRGDKRTKRGKIWRGSYGKSRQKNNKAAAEQQPKSSEE